MQLTAVAVSLPVIKELAKFENQIPCLSNVIGSIPARQLRWQYVRVNLLKSWRLANSPYRTKKHEQMSTSFGIPFTMCERSYLTSDTVDRQTAVVITLLVTTTDYPGRCCHINTHTLKTQNRPEMPIFFGLVAPLINKENKANFP